MHNPESFLENEIHKLLWDFEIQTDHLISARRQDLDTVKKKKKEKKKDLPISQLCRSNWPQNKIKRNKYLHLASELKQLWNMKVTVIPIVIGALRTIRKGLVKWLEDLEINGQVVTIQTSALLRSARKLRRVQGTWEDLLSLPVN